MKSSVTLAMPQHDPEGTSLTRWQHALPQIQSTFAETVVDVSPETDRQQRDFLAAHFTLVEENARAWSLEGIVLAGKFRRNLMEMALRTHSPFFLYCDGDRLLHWLERYPDELNAVVRRIPRHDFTVLGRTDRALRAHPAVQRDTERIINGVFKRISGHDWDVTAAARGLSRAAAQVVVDQSDDDTFGNDASWPLLIQRTGGLTMAEIKTEGLEYETAGKYAQATAGLGGESEWKLQIDNDPRHWIQRLNLARIEVESMLPYWKRQE